MSRRVLKTAPLLLALMGALALAACGAEAETEAPEGEPIELGPLSYNVVITRFLNPADPQDSAYLADQPEPPAEQAYLGVFLTIENESDEEQSVPSEFLLADSPPQSEFEPVPSESEFALEPGAVIPPEGRIPEPGSPADEGPIGGAMLLFLVDEAVGENRPLRLEIPSTEGGEPGSIELDI